MAGKYSVKETIDVINFMLPVASALQAAKANDGKIDYKDLALLAPTLPAAFPAISGADAIPAELSEMDAEDIEQVKQAILAKMPILGAKWLTVAENCLAAAVAIYKTVRALQN